VRKVDFALALHGLPVLHINEVQISTKHVFNVPTHNKIESYQNPDCVLKTELRSVKNQNLYIVTPLGVMIG